MKVERVETETGWRIEPPLDQQWDDLTKLKWKASVVGLECPITPRVEQSEQSTKILGVWVSVRGQYQVLLPGRSQSTGDFHATWSFLNGFEAGASCR